MRPHLAHTLLPIFDASIVMEHLTTYRNHIGTFVKHAWMSSHMLSVHIIKGRFIRYGKIYKMQYVDVELMLRRIDVTEAWPHGPWRSFLMFKRQVR